MILSRRAARSPGVFPCCFIKPSSPRHASVVIASHNPGFDKWLNEMRVTMRKTLASLADPVAFPAVFTAVYLVPAGAFGV